MALTCVRCGRSGEPPAPHRVGYPSAFKQQVLGSICEACWKEWEGMEVKVINEYRLSFIDPQHRQTLQQACADFLALGRVQP